MERWTLLYDRDCGFCRWSLAKVLVLDRDRQLRPVAIQDSEADELLAAVPMDRRLSSWHLVEPAGTVRSGGDAAPALLRLLPGGRLPGRIAARFPDATERSYRWVANHRSMLGRPIGRRARERADARIEQREP